MARTRPRLLLPVLMLAAACARAGDGAAAAGRNDSAGQAAAPAGPDTAQARTAVLALEKELFGSFVRADTAPAARILADDYVGLTGDGDRETKAQMLANLRRGGSAPADGKADTLQVDSTTVRVYGDAAVAQTGGTFEKRSGPQRGTVGFRNTDVFVWRDGRWQLVATHLSKVAAP